MNTFFAIGNMTKDPELRTTATGKSVCRFTIAVNGIKSKNNENPRVDYIPCIAWEAQAENIAKYLTKGRMVAIKGSLRSGSYEKDGQKRFTLEVELDRFDGLKFLSNGKKDETQSADTAVYPHPGPSTDGFIPVETDELPF